MVAPLPRPPPPLHPHPLNFTGLVSFQYTVSSDDGAVCTPATIEITVVALCPCQCLPGCMAVGHAAVLLLCRSPPCASGATGCSLTSAAPNRSFFECFLFWAGPTRDRGIGPDGPCRPRQWKCWGVRPGGFLDPLPPSIEDPPTP